jgi:phosphotriesterase-related protein
VVASPEDRLIVVIAELVKRGWAQRLLLSQDVCHRSHLKAYAGNGYDYLIRCFLPRLRDAGIDEDSIRLMTVDNPRRLVAGA